MTLHDISQPVGTGTAEWPGDRPFELEWTMRRDAGASVNVAAIAMSVHTGTHADGPLHTTDEGGTVESVPLDAFIGPARVVDARGRAAVDVDAVEGLDLAAEERLLFRTRERVEPGAFPDDFAAIAPALAERLVAAGVRLVGTDAPSVDPADSKMLETHRVLAAGGIVNLENLALSGVSEGRYTLVALPLRLVETDSAPVRAVLIEGGL